MGAYVWPVLGVLLAAATLAGTVQLAGLTLAALLPARRRPARDSRSAAPRVAVVVPAHDEENGIERTVRCLLACEGADQRCEVVVVADNCSDATAARAAAAGARVLERRDLGRRGKGYALDFAFRALLPEGFDVFVVIDADTVVEPDLIAEVRAAFADGAAAAQARYVVLDPGASLRHRLMNLAFVAINVVRPRGRERLGLSAGIVGNGFALHRDTLRAVPYEAASIVEDLEYHLRLVRSGRRVRFLDRATVRGEMPAGGAGARTQRARWEGGRLLMIKEFVPALARDVARGRLRLLEPLLDLLLLPLAFHVLLLVLALAVPFAPTRVYAAIGLCAVALHVAVALAVSGRGLRDLPALAAVPFYLVWKLGIAKTILRAGRRDAAWVRTQRQ
jgi:cellulose synthase/poly-beta-1,6-N-acetylglucosamine synthase-like glycosyltransferase